MDHILRPVDELPKWGEERVAREMECRVAGSAGYCALALAALGDHPHVVGNVGNDARGVRILDALQRVGAETQAVALTPMPTAVSITLVNRHGERAFVTYLGHLPELRVESILESLGAYPALGHVIFAGYFLLPGIGGSGLIKIFRRCRERGGVVILDTGDDPRGWSTQTLRELRLILRHVDVFLPNDDEAEAITRQSRADRAARALLDLGAATVVVKRGPKGALYAQRTSLFRAPAFRVPVMDTAGAGDAFNAGFSFGLRQGWDARSAVSFANAVAALTISRGGRRYPSAREAAVLCGLGEGADTR
jgi:argininosuccinate lyase